MTSSRSIDEVKIVLVDGEKVRSKEIDFALGGHAYRYPKLIPENEIWIESSLKGKDKIATIVHELVERSVIKMRGMKYDKAHTKFANSVERDIRSALKGGSFRMKKPAKVRKILPQGAMGAMKWKPPKTKSARLAHMSKCGEKCYLDPKADKPGFPVCDSKCKFSCKGIMAAYKRAKQFKHQKIASKALALAKKQGCGTRR